MPYRPLSHLDRLFLWVRSKDLFYRLTLFTRIMLAAGFIPTGTVKLLGRRFTTMPLRARLVARLAIPLGVVAGVAVLLRFVFVPRRRRASGG